MTVKTNKRNRLILVEGLPGSGKSTFADRIGRHYEGLQGANTVQVYHEGGYHPADLGWQACLTQDQYDNILQAYACFQEDMERLKVVEEDLILIPYTKILAPPEQYGFYDVMSSYEVYNGRVPFEIFQEMLLKRWQRFGKDTAAQNIRTVFECAFLQMHVTELLYFHDKGFAEIKDHIQKLWQAVADLEPVVVYLRQENVWAALEKTAAKRIYPHGRWIDQIIEFTETSTYGKKEGLQGFEGAVKALERRQAIELDILRALHMPTLILENKDEDWEAMWRQLAPQLT